MLEPRKQIKDFTVLMEQQLIKNEDKGGWEKDDTFEGYWFFFREINKHFLKLYFFMTSADIGTINYKDKWKEQIQITLANIANFCMIINDNLTRKK